MLAAHKIPYDWSHKKLDQPRIGVAQHVGSHTGRGFMNRSLSKLSVPFMNWCFLNRIQGYMNYFGFNYYGAEWIKELSISIDPDEEYSEAGRAIDPEGFYLLPKKIKKRFGPIPQFITENGIADPTDQRRPATLLSI